MTHQQSKVSLLEKLGEYSVDARQFQHILQLQHLVHIVFLSVDAPVLE
jgi:hypothetical protein